MKRKLIGGLMLVGLLLVFGCNPKIGIISLDTNPQGATVYLNGVPSGETPTKFEFDMEKPVTLGILKEGYVSQTESLNVAWVKREYSEGHYKRGDYVIKGEKQAGFEVQTKRELKEDTEPRRIQEFRIWCDSMIGKDYHEVVKRLGLPGQTADLPNGNKALIFDRGLPGITPPRFETDSNGIVIRWTP